MHYYPKFIDFKSQLTADDTTDLNFSQIYAGKKHYTLVNNDNQILSFGDLLKNQGTIEELDGFKIHFGDNLFDGKRLKYLSAKYGVFGAIVE